MHNCVYFYSSQEPKPSSTTELSSPADIYNQYIAMQPFPEPSHQSAPSSASATSASASSSSSTATQSSEPSLKSIMKPARPPPSPEPVKQKPAKQILPQLDSVSIYCVFSIQVYPKLHLEESS